MSNTCDQAIRCENVAFTYNGRLVLDNATLCIASTDFAYVVGPNGGGKTTLLKLLIGILEPESGNIKIFGLPPREARNRIGYVPQTHLYDPYFPVRALEVVLMGRVEKSPLLGPYRKADIAIAHECLEQVHIDHLAKRPLSELSGGERQRVMIARALAGNPDIILMDEPTANLDLSAESDLFKLLSSLSKKLTVVMVSHDIGFVSKDVTKVICVNKKVFVHPTSVITTEMIKEMYGSDVRLVRHDEKEEPHRHD